MNTTKLIIIGSCIPVFTSVIYAACCYRRLNPALRLFSWFLFISGIIQAVSLVLWFMSVNNLPLLHIYVAAGFLALALFYNYLLRDFIDQRLMLFLIASFLCFTLLNSVYVQPVDTFNSYALTVESVVIIIFSISTLMLGQHEVTRENQRPVFASLNWINSGLLIFYTSDILIFYFGDSLIDFFPTYMNRYAWVAHSFFSAIMYSCFFIGLWKSQKN
jgi:hypothetical protein